MLYICPWQAPELPPERLISSMITEASVKPEARAAIFLGNQRGQPAGLGERGDEFFRIGALLVDSAKIFRRKLRAELANRRNVFPDIGRVRSAKRVSPCAFVIADCDDSCERSRRLHAKPAFVVLRP